MPVQPDELRSRVLSALSRCSPVAASSRRDRPRSPPTVSVDHASTEPVVRSVARSAPRCPAWCGAPSSGPRDALSPRNRRFQNRGVPREGRRGGPCGRVPTPDRSRSRRNARRQPSTSPTRPPAISTDGQRGSRIDRTERARSAAVRGALCFSDEPTWRDAWRASGDVRGVRVQRRWSKRRVFSEKPVARSSSTFGHRNPCGRSVTCSAANPRDTVFLSQKSKISNSGGPREGKRGGPCGRVPTHDRSRSPRAIAGSRPQVRRDRRRSPPPVSGASRAMNRPLSASGGARSVTCSATNLATHPPHPEIEAQGRDGPREGERGAQDAPIPCPRTNEPPRSDHLVVRPPNA